MRTPAGEAIIGLIRELPQASNLAIARAAKKRWPSLFNSVEAARSRVRFYRGAIGEMHRKRAIMPRPATDAQACKSSGYGIPAPRENPWGWRELPKGVKRWAVLADLHVPYHDVSAIQLAIDNSRDCDGCLILGDMLDCYALSPWLRDPRERDFAAEVEAGKQMLAVLCQQYKTVVWKLGNHEQRLERYLQAHAPELFGIANFTLASICETSERGIEVIDAMDPIRCGKLIVLHGHEAGRGMTSPVNPARGVYLRGHECTLIGHEHRTSQHAEPTWSGTLTTCWSVGCLCDLHPKYRPLNAWNHGLAKLDVTDKSGWRIENYRITDGMVV